MAAVAMLTMSLAVAASVGAFAISTMFLPMVIFMLMFGGFFGSFALLGVGLVFPQLVSMVSIQQHGQQFVTTATRRTMDQPEMAFAFQGACASDLIGRKRLLPLLCTHAAHGLCACHSALPLPAFRWLLAAHWHWAGAWCAASCQPSQRPSSPSQSRLAGRLRSQSLMLTQRRRRWAAAAGTAQA